MNKKHKQFSIMIGVAVLVLAGCSDQLADNSENVPPTGTLPPIEQQDDNDPAAGVTPDDQKFDDGGLVLDDPSTGDDDSDNSKGVIDTTNWNSFTHKAYGYTVQFPEDWHWDGSNVNELIISSEPINLQNPLNANSIIISSEDKIWIAITSLDTLYQKDDLQISALSLLDNNHAEIFKLIIDSFVINE